MAAFFLPEARMAFAILLALSDQVTEIDTLSLVFSRPMKWEPQHGKPHQARTLEGLTWNFQPPRAPHFGEAHQSLVRSTKLALYRALDIEKKRNRYTSEEVLRTLFAEVISILNSRTLGYMSSDPKDLPTPNDLLNRPPGYLRVPFISPQDEDSAKRYSRR